MKIFDAKPTFASGELSPLLYGRVDLAQYMRGVRELVNFIVLPQGGVCNRPGTRRFSGTYDDVRLAPFVVGDSGSFVLVFSDSYIDVFNADGYVATVSGSPFLAKHLSEMRWLQSNDIMYLFHRDVPTQKLSHYGPTSWTLAPVDFQHGPHREMNTDENKKMHVYIVNTATPPDDPVFQQRIGSTWDFFTPDMVGMYIAFEQKIKAGSGSTILRTPTQPQSETIMPYGAFAAGSRGKWLGTVKLWRKLPDEEEFEAIKTWEAEEDYNFAYSASVDEYGTEYYFTWEASSSSYRTIEIFWSWDGGIVRREFKITQYIAPDTVAVEPLDGIVGNIDPTADWQIGAFGSSYGYPAMGIFHQERLVLANTKADPQTIWMSRSASWEDFQTHIPVVDDDSIIVTLASKQVNEICGLASRSDLLIFTTGGEWVAKAGSKSDVFTPSSIYIVPSGYRGSAWIEPLDVGTATLFTQRGARCIRGMGYELQIDGYTSSDMTILSQHLFESGTIRRCCYQQEPWSVVWVVRSDGKVMSFTLQQEHQVQAWARHDFSGKVVDICAIPGEEQDDLFLAVERGGSIGIEVMQVRKDATLDAGVYKDAGQYAVKSSLETLDWEQQVNGTLQGRHKDIPAMTLRLHRTCGAWAGIMNENNDQLDQLRFGPSPGNVTTPYSGDVRIEARGGMARICRLRIENRDPQPIALLAVYPEVTISEG